MDKENVVVMHNSILFDPQKSLNSVICNIMDETGGHLLSKISDAHKQKYCIYIWNLKKLISQKLRLELRLPDEK